MIYIRLFLLVLDHLICEIVQLNFSGLQILRILQKAAVKICTCRNLPHRPTVTNRPTSGQDSSFYDCFMWLRGKLGLPVLMDEALILFVGVDDCQDVGHLSVDAHHIMMEEGGDVKVLLQDLLPGTDVEKSQKLDLDLTEALFYPLDALRLDVLSFKPTTEQNKNKSII